MKKIKLIATFLVMAIFSAQAQKMSALPVLANPDTNAMTFVVPAGGSQTYQTTLAKLVRLVPTPASVATIYNHDGNLPNATQRYIGMDSNSSLGMLIFKGRDTSGLVISNVRRGIIGGYNFNGIFDLSMFGGTPDAAYFGAYANNAPYMFSDSIFGFNLVSTLGASYKILDTGIQLNNLHGTAWLLTNSAPTTEGQVLMCNASNKSSYWADLPTSTDTVPSWDAVTNVGNATQNDFMSIKTDQATDIIQGSIDFWNSYSNSLGSNLKSINHSGYNTLCLPVAGSGSVDALAISVNGNKADSTGNIALVTPHNIINTTSGSNVALVANSYNIINFTGVTVTLTLDLPSTTTDGDYFEAKFENACTVTYSGGSVGAPISTITQGQLIKYVYDSATSTWY